MFVDLLAGKEFRFQNQFLHGPAVIGQLPNSWRVAASDGEEPLAVRAELNLLNRPGGVTETGDELPCLRIPEFRLGIAAGGEQQPPVGAVRQIRTTLSSLSVARRSPPGLNRASRTNSLCRRTGLIGWPVFASQIRAVPPVQAEANCFPSGLNSMEEILLGCAMGGVIGCPVRTFHTCRLSFSAAVKTLWLFGLNAVNTTVARCGRLLKPDSTDVKSQMRAV